MKKPFLFSMFIFLVLLFGGCDKYTDVTLSTGCLEEFPTVGYLTGQHGKVQSATEGDQANLIILEKSDGTNSLIFACNLPEEYQKRGLEVIFDGEIKDVPNMICDTLPNDSVYCVTIDILGTPVYLTDLKVKD